MTYRINFLCNLGLDCFSLKGENEVMAYAAALDALPGVMVTSITIEGN